MAQLGSAVALGATGRRFESYHSDQSPLIKQMSIRTRKSDRTKFGFFKNEKIARAEIARRKNLTDDSTLTYYVIKVKRGKEGQNPWMAYSLKRKKGR